MSPQVQQTEDNSDFFKYLQPTSTATTTMPSNGSVLDNDEEPWDISAALSAGDLDTVPLILKCNKKECCHCERKIIIVTYGRDLFYNA